ncbi:methionine ABC transporter permease [Saxibacter everestensis]|uniref:Methionine ABC transporter permease n=1 Tax=Saxibacter everestensis TaxID=2909229 RepID=A0ABY8QQA5_9MICO|nr:methionine ABC transporter permease [Brevibacteriaceae bacterium ZFBP1038]
MNAELTGVSAILAAAKDPQWFNNPVIQDQVLPATLETIYMTVVASIVAALLGLPLGIWLHVTSPKGLSPQVAVYRMLSLIIDIGRSIPFIILMIALIPFTRFMVDTALGWYAAAVPLSVGAIPFFARLVENALREVGLGKVEAAQMMGASKRQIIRDVLYKEARPGIVGGLTITIVTLIAYTAMAGAVGGGGLGALAISYGYQRYQGDVMIVCIVLLVALVAIVQFFGDRIARLIDHR